MFSDISYLGEHIEALNKYKDNLSNENLIEIFNHKLLIKLNTLPNYSTLKIDNKLITKESLEISGIFGLKMTNQNLFILVNLLMMVIL